LKKLGKKLSLRKETLLHLRYVTSGNVTTLQGTDPDRTTAPSSGVVEICYFSDCNPCDTQAMCGQTVMN
jgi:hypothetical protein